MLRIFIISISIIISTFLILDWLFPLDKKRIYKPSSTMIYDKKHKLLGIHLSEDGFVRMPLQEDEITEDLKTLLLSYEDRYFYSHFGINPISIIRATLFNITNRRVIGASTITMQVARMANHKPRSIKSKLIESFMALQLEYHYSKDEILKIYLNNTPYGGNIEGFKSASFLYFSKPISSLSFAEIAYLISIPKNPNKNRPKDTNRANILKDKVIARVRTNLDRCKRALKEKIEPKRRRLPNYAPHLLVGFNNGKEVITTIDLSLQIGIEKIIKERIKRLKNLDIHNGMAIVIDNKTMEILAYVGSQNFKDKLYSGEVDGLKALISAGSTLKPFIYAKAFEMGIITPLKKIYDVPISIGGYKPLNYSKEFLGEISAKEALWLSLNIPAIELDMALKDKSLYHILKESNIGSLDMPKEYYGSSLVLGGFGITLREITELFSSLANGGIFEPSYTIKNRDNRDKRRLISKEASYLVTEILANAPRKELSSSWEYVKDMPKVAFKTGTSARARDMLSVGYTPEYSVGVWYGNFNGKAPKVKDKKDDKLTGLSATSPTLLDIFKLLEPKGWFKKVNGITKRSICTDAIVIGECKERVIDDIIDGVKRETPCNMIRAIENNPTDKSIKELKIHRCYKEWRGYPPQITTLSNNQKIIQNSMLPNYLKEIKLECKSFESDNRVLWSIDNKEIISGYSATPIYKNFNIGIHKLKCIDWGGKAKSITIYIDEI